jgi:hypothetical protein
MGTIIITCLKCGNRFKPGDAPFVPPKESALSAKEQAALDEKDTQVGMNALGVLLVLAVGLVLIILAYHWLFP